MTNDDSVLTFPLAPVTIAAMYRTRLTSAILAGASLFPLVGCDAEDSADTSDFELLDATDTLLAEAETPEGVRIEFRQTENGGGLVSEYGPADAPSPLIYLNAKEEHSTPLEVFLALAPDDTPPHELVESHEAAMRESGQPLAPRRLTLPNPGFRSSDTDYYNTNCSATADEAWFDYWWGALSYVWHDYWWGSYNGWDGEVFTNTSPPTTSFISHLCVWSVNNHPTGTPYSGPLNHYLYTDSGIVYPYVGQYVYTAHRSVLWIWDEYDQFRGMTNAPNYTVATVGLGGMAN